MAADLEKVIRGLEVCLDRTGDPHNCKRCPYHCCVTRGCVMCGQWEMLEDALALLRADEREEDDGK